MSRSTLFVCAIGLLFCVGCPRPAECDACATDATCVTTSTPAVCTCNDGFVGDGATCTAIPNVQLKVVQRSTLAFQPHAPLWAALQIGDGAYAPLTATSDGVYDFTVPDAAGRYAVAVVCRGFNGAIRVWDYRTTVAEIPAPTLYCDLAVDSEKVAITVEYNNPGIGATQGTANLGGVAFGSPIPGAGATNPVPKGLHDLFASTSDSGGLLRGLLKHDESVTVAGTRVLDFATGFDFVTSSVTLQGVTAADTTLQLSTSIVTREFFHSIESGSTNGDALAQVPTFALGTGDFNLAIAVGTGTDARQRGTYRFSKAPGNVSLSSPAYFTSAIVDVVETVPYNRLRAQWTGAPAASSPFVLNSQSGGPTVLMFASRGWIGAAEQLSFPALASVAGWDNAWAPMSGTEVSWGLYSSTSNRSPAALTDFALGFTGVTDGLQLDLQLRQGSFTP